MTLQEGKGAVRNCKRVVETLSGNNVLRFYFRMIR